MIGSSSKEEGRESISQYFGQSAAIQGGILVCVLHTGMLEYNK